MINIFRCFKCGGNLFEDMHHFRFHCENCKIWYSSDILLSLSSSTYSILNNKND